MPRQRRKLSKTGTYHIMLRGNERKSIFLEEEDYRKFLQILAIKKKRRFLFVICLLFNEQSSPFTDKRKKTEYISDYEEN